MFKTTKAWLQILRFPNLFTAPGDPVAGLAVAAFFFPEAAPTVEILVYAGLAGLCLYAFGVILNDIADLPVDIIVRPERPLPRKALSVGRASAAAAVLVFASLTFAYLANPQSMVAVLVLVALIMLYDFITKHLGILGCLNMGLCRAGSFMLVVPVAQWHVLQVIMALGITAYVATLTRVSQQEDEESQIQRLRAYGPAFALLCFAYLPLQLASTQLPAREFGLLAACLTAALVYCLAMGWRLAAATAAPAVTRKAIGVFVRNLIFIQAACALFLPSDGWFLALILLALWPASTLAGKAFSAS